MPYVRGVIKSMASCYCCYAGTKQRVFMLASQVVRKERYVVQQHRNVSYAVFWLLSKSA